MRKLIAGLAIAATLATGMAQARPGDGWRERMAERFGQGQAEAAPADRTLAYGEDPLQQVDLWFPRGDGGAHPLVLFVHGGGWSKGDKSNGSGRWKATHYPQAGYLFASANYRLVPQASVEQQAEDVAMALKALLDRARELGVDKRRVVLMGHSAGAHLVALVGTDERYLRAAGLSYADLAGVVALDGAGYEVSAQMDKGGPRLRQTYEQAFGGDPARQRALSPMNHVAAPNAGRFLVLHVDRAASVRQSPALAEALRRAGTPAETQSVEGRGLMGHLEINRRLGDPDYPATPLVDQWLKDLFGV